MQVTYCFTAGCRMRASASDTALDRLDAASISAQRYLSPNINDNNNSSSVASPSWPSSSRYGANFPATPPRKQPPPAARAASQPAVPAPNKRIRAAAARHAMSARLPEVSAFPLPSNT